MVYIFAGTFFILALVYGLVATTTTTTTTLKIGLIGTKVYWLVGETYMNMDRKFGCPSVHG